MEAPANDTTLRSLGFLTEAETAELLSVKVVTLRNWRARNLGPQFTKVSGEKTAYSLEGVRNYLKERTVTPTKPPSLARPKARTAAKSRSA